MHDNGVLGDVFYLNHIAELMAHAQSRVHGCQGLHCEFRLMHAACANHYGLRPVQDLQH